MDTDSNGPRHFQDVDTVADVLFAEWEKENR